MWPQQHRTNQISMNPFAAFDPTDHPVKLRSEKASGLAS